MATRADVGETRLRVGADPGHMHEPGVNQRGIGTRDQRPIGTHTGG
ncbi:MAG TPA: hypothetical protein VJO34_08630 [Methylomirabilota bacterium]|nr:hypothetical protein [Methylomirabilota bacterium]